MRTPKRKSRPVFPGDVLIDEIHAVRRRIWKEGGGTVDGYMARVRESSQQHKSSAEGHAAKAGR